MATKWDFSLRLAAVDMHAEIITTAFNPWQALADYESRLDLSKCGGNAVFTGNMRDHNQGDEVTTLYLDHYPGMTEKYLQQSLQDAAQRWQVIDALILHRAGSISPGETIVLAAAWAAHREPAFAACRYLVEELKSRVPFWKKEQLKDGGRWLNPA